MSPMRKTRRSTEFKNNSRVIDMEEARAKRQAKRKAQQKSRKKREKKKQPESYGKRAIRRKRNRTRIWIAILILVIVGVLTYEGYHVFSLISEKNKVKAQQESLIKEKKDLEEQLANASDKETLEDIARQELRLIKPGEVLYMFPSNFDGKSSK